MKVIFDDIKNVSKDDQIGVYRYGDDFYEGYGAKEGYIEYDPEQGAWVYLSFAHDDNGEPLDYIEAGDTYYESLEETIDEIESEYANN